MESSIKDIMEALRQRWMDANDEMKRLASSNISLATIVRQMESAMQAFISHEGAWDRIDIELREHEKSLATHCNGLEASIQQKRVFMLPNAEQKFLAGNTQRIAKHIADKADHEVRRRGGGRRRR